MTALRRSLAVLLGSVAVCCLVACGGDADLAGSDELGGLPTADVALALADESTEYDSTEVALESYQRYVKVWNACRAVYEVYEQLVMTGELADRPEPIHADRDVGSTHEATVGVIADLYDPMADGNPAGTRSQLASDQQCGSIPVNESGDRSVDIAEAVEDL
jgi:hypothetical protein